MKKLLQKIDPVALLIVIYAFTTLKNGEFFHPDPNMTKKLVRLRFEQMFPKNNYHT